MPMWCSGWYNGTTKWLIDRRDCWVGAVMVCATLSSFGKFELMANLNWKNPFCFRGQSGTFTWNFYMKLCMKHQSLDTYVFGIFKNFIIFMCFYFLWIFMGFCLYSFLWAFWVFVEYRVDYSTYIHQLIDTIFIALSCRVLPLPLAALPGREFALLCGCFLFPASS